MGNLLEVQDLTKYFRHQWTFRPFCALDGLTVSLREGEIFGLIGRNGAGKTTTFKLILGLLRASRGEVRLLGQPSYSAWARRQIGFLPEHPYFYDYLSVGEILDFYADLCRLDAGEKRRRIAALVERLHLGPKLRAPVRSLSKGTLQRVGIAQAILHRPRLVILDEPMSGLDPAGRREMRELIRSLKDEGSTVIFSSHILPDAEALCDRVGMILNGKLRELVDLTDVQRRGNGFTIAVSGLEPHGVSAIEAICGQPAGGGPAMWTVQASSRDQVAAILRAAQERGGFVESLVPTKLSLEDRFISFLQGDHAAD